MATKKPATKAKAKAKAKTKTKPVQPASFNEIEQCFIANNSGLKPAVLATKLGRDKADVTAYLAMQKKAASEAVAIDNSGTKHRGYAKELANSVAPCFPNGVRKDELDGAEERYLEKQRLKGRRT